MISDRGASSMTVVTLSLDELRQAAWVGVARTLRAINKARREPHGHPAERGEWEISIHGAAAEMAVAKTLGLYWGDDRNLDYGGDVFIPRSLHRPSDGHCSSTSATRIRRLFRARRHCGHADVSDTLFIRLDGKRAEYVTSPGASDHLAISVPEAPDRSRNCCDGECPGGPAARDRGVDRRRQRRRSFMTRSRRSYARAAGLDHERQRRDRRCEPAPPGGGEPWRRDRAAVGATRYWS
jgi:hypothetical protein